MLRFENIRLYELKEIHNNEFTFTITEDYQTRPCRTIRSRADKFIITKNDFIEIVDDAIEIDNNIIGIQDIIYAFTEERKITHLYTQDKVICAATLTVTNFIIQDLSGNWSTKHDTYTKVSYLGCCKNCSKSCDGIYEGTIQCWKANKIYIGNKIVEFTDRIISSVIHKPRITIVERFDDIPQYTVHSINGNKITLKSGHEYITTTVNDRFDIRCKYVETVKGLAKIYNNMFCFQMQYGINLKDITKIILVDNKISHVYNGDKQQILCCVQNNYSDDYIKIKHDVIWSCLKNRTANITVCDQCTSGYTTLTEPVTIIENSERLIVHDAKGKYYKSELVYDNHCKIIVNEYIANQ